MQRFKRVERLIGYADKRIPYQLLYGITNKLKPEYRLYLMNCNLLMFSRPIIPSFMIICISYVFFNLYRNLLSFNKLYLLFNIYLLYFMQYHILNKLYLLYTICIIHSIFYNIILAIH